MKLIIQTIAKRKTAQSSLGFFDADETSNAFLGTKSSREAEEGNYGDALLAIYVCKEDPFRFQGSFFVDASLVPRRGEIWDIYIGNLENDTRPFPMQMPEFKNLQESNSLDQSMLKIDEARLATVGPFEKGIGTRILQVLVQIGKAVDVTAIELHSIRTTAGNFYKKFGFRTGPEQRYVYWIDKEARRKYEEQRDKEYRKLGYSPYNSEEDY